MSGRPSYWNVSMPSYCRTIPSYFQKGEICYCPRLHDELDQFNPDLVVVGGAWYMIGVFQAYRWAKKNNRLTATFPWEFSSKMFRWTTIIRNLFLYNFIYKGIDIFLANGYIHFDYFKMILGKSNVRIFSNFDNYAPYLNHPKRVNTGTITFMYGGAIDRRMRVPELLDVFERLRVSYEGVRLIIGGYGPEKKQCEEIVRQSPILSSSVEFHNVQAWEEIPDVYKRCDVLVNYASFSPGAGVVYSAIASGMGLITTTTIHASRTHVIDNYNGFLVDNKEELFTAMQRYVDDKDLLEKHSITNRNIGLDCLTFEQHLDDFSSLVDPML